MLKKHSLKERLWEIVLDLGRIYFLQKTNYAHHGPVSHLGKRFQSYFLWDICFNSAVRRAQGLKWTPSIFVQKITGKNTLLVWIFDLIHLEIAMDLKCKNKSCRNYSSGASYKVSEILDVIEQSYSGKCTVGFWWKCLYAFLSTALSANATLRVSKHILNKAYTREYS